MIQMGKESVEELQSLALFNEETDWDPDIPWWERYSAEILYCLKLPGIGGAYCDLCDLSKEQCNKIETVEEGILINKDIESMKDIFGSL